MLGTALVIFPVALFYSVVFRYKAIYRIVPLYRGWARVFNFLVFVKIKEHWAEPVNPKHAYIAVGNHGSFMDIMAFGSTLPTVYKAVAKRELLRLPIIGIVFKMAGIMVDRSSEESRKRTVANMREHIANGIGIMIFAEGTRNRTNNLLMPFKDGAFKISMETGADILPFAIVGAKEIMAPGSLIMRPGTIHIYYLPVVKAADFSSVEEQKKFVFDAIHKTLIENSGN